MTQNFIAFDGSVHHVRDGFHIFVDGHSRDEEKAAITRWQATAPADKPWLRHRDPLSPRQLKYLDAWTNRNNMNSALAYLKGRDYREFGFETLCQVHGNLHTFPCGCKHHVIFDHHKRELGYEDSDIKPLRAEEVCDRHRHHNDLNSLYWAGARDSHERK